MTELTEGRHSSEFVLSEAARSRSRENIVVESGAGVLAPGTVIGAKSNGKYIASPVATDDGAETATAVLLFGVDATSADQDAVAIARDAEVNVNLLSYASDADTQNERDAKATELAAVGVIVR